MVEGDFPPECKKPRITSGAFLQFKMSGQVCRITTNRLYLEGLKRRPGWQLSRNASQPAMIGRRRGKTSSDNRWFIRYCKMTDERGFLFAKLVHMLDWAYEKTQSSHFGWASAEQLAQDYVGKFSDPDDAIDSLINWQTGSAGIAGFVTGVGGMWFLPIGVPANLATVLCIQLRMISAIALIRGYSPKSDQVRTLAYASLCGMGARDILKDVGTKIGTKIVVSASRETMLKINQRVGSRLLTKMGGTGAVNLGRMLPVIGGLVSGGIDASATKIIGVTARSLFTQPDRRAPRWDCDQTPGTELVTPHDL